MKPLFRFKPEGKSTVEIHGYVSVSAEGLFDDGPLIVKLNGYTVPVDEAEDLMERADKHNLAYFKYLQNLPEKEAPEEKPDPRLFYVSEREFYDLTEGRSNQIRINALNPNVASVSSLWPVGVIQELAVRGVDGAHRTGHFFKCIQAGLEPLCPVKDASFIKMYLAPQTNLKTHGTCVLTLDFVGKGLAHAKG